MFKKIPALKLLVLMLFILISTGSAQAASSFVFNNNLKQGSTSQDVKELQQYLNANGDQVAITGAGSKGQESINFGQATKEALIKFQKNNKILPANGYFGPLTRNFINKKLLSVVSVMPTSENMGLISAPVVTSENKYSIGGSITGLAGAVTLKNNGADDITINITDSSNFSFPTKVANGTKYEVSVVPKFLGQKCYADSNTGSVTGADLKDIKIACGAHLDYNPFKFIPSSGSVTITEKFNDLLSVLFSPGASRIALTFQKVGQSANVGTPITLSATPAADASIFYTMDGSEPSNLSTKYTGPINVNSDLTIKANAYKSSYSNFATISSSYKINQSTGGLFANPHGTVRVGNKFFIGSRTNPATITVFNNPNDLSDYQTVTLTGHSNLDYLIYDDVNDKLYASCYDGEAYQVPHKMTILKINPNNLNDWSVVYNNAFLWSDWSAPIVTDGTYIYGATFNVDPAQLFKIRISDGFLVTWRGWTGVYYPHAAAIVKYAGRSEMYITSVFDAPNRFAKVNLSNLTFTSVSMGTNDYLTDDIACRYMDDTGSICYMGTDEGSVSPLGYKMDTRTMATSTFSIGGANTYGMFIKDNDLYAMGINDTLVRYKNFNTAAPEIFSTPGITPNEMLYSTDGKMFITDWSASSRLVEFKLAE
ncbi:MAG: chitobiase/beta-hexosaminidase C-terminal domain-containing protein [Candidatus Falkowbacteria bacterium]